MDNRIMLDGSDLRLDGGEDAGNLFKRTVEVIGRKHPQCYGRHPKIGAPVENVVELLRTDRVDRPRVSNPISFAVPPVPIEDDADMPGNGMLFYLPSEPLIVQAIERSKRPGQQTGPRTIS